MAESRCWLIKGKRQSPPPTADPDLLLLGFLTRDGLDELGLPGLASVYVPQSYNFAGQLVLVPRDRVRTLDAGHTALGVDPGDLLDRPIDVLA